MSVKRIAPISSAVALLCLAQQVLAQTPPAAPAAPAPYDLKANYTKYEYKVPTRDGKRLFTVVYVPKEAEASGKRYPFLMTRTPYSCGPYGVDRYGSRFAPSEDFLKAGYIFVCQDVRGRYMSEGVYQEMAPIKPNKGPKDADASTDMHDTVQWLLDHVKGHNGRLGLWGISYPGFYTSTGIIDSHPAIKAASPQAPIADYFHRDDGYHGGAVMLAHNYGFLTAFRPQDNPTVEPKRWTTFDYNSKDAYDYFLKLGNLDSIAKSIGKERNPYFDELIENDRYNDYWKARSVGPHLKNIKAAVLTVGGWFDAEDLSGALATYQFIEKQNPGISNALVMGPWIHGGWVRTVGKGLGAVDFGSKTSEHFQKQILLPFFEQHLRGGADAKLPEASIFETGTNVWRQYSAWPPAEAKVRSLYLQAGGKLAWTAPGAGKAEFDSYVSDPSKPVPFIGYASLGMPQEYMVADQRFASTRPDVLVYQTDALEEDVTVAGPVSPRLFVSTTGTDADWVVKLIDVYPPDAGEETPRNREQIADVPPPPGFQLGGYQQLVRGDPLRSRFRKSFEKPEAMVPGQVEEIRFDIPDVAHTFRRGHRIMVQIQSSWFPLIDRNPQTFVQIRSAKPEDFKAATQKVFHWKEQPSAVQLRVMDGGR
ncbi:CocE/NonD family hydrolase [Roseateles subflavus]|uniref:CocE/NonD family hydrolase n=1 Tax=Roseateles subflavus TaxID=3053353 RepID=UPI003D9C762B